MSCSSNQKYTICVEIDEMYLCFYEDKDGVIQITEEEMNNELGSSQLIQHEIIIELDEINPKIIWDKITEDIVKSTFKSVGNCEFDDISQDTKDRLKKRLENLNDDDKCMIRGYLRINLCPSFLG